MCRLRSLGCACHGVSVMCARNLGCVCHVTCVMSVVCVMCAMCGVCCACCVVCYVLVAMYIVWYVVGGVVLCLVWCVVCGVFCFVSICVSSQVCLLKLFVERSTVRWRDEPWHRFMEPLAGFTGELWQRVMGPTMVGFMEPTGLMGNCIGWF